MALGARVEWRRFRRPDYLIWLVLFGALAAFSPGQSPIVITLLIAIGVAQVFEPRIGARNTVILNLLLCYALICFGKPFPLQIESSFWGMLFLPADPDNYGDFVGGFFA